MTRKELVALQLQNYAEGRRELAMLEAQLAAYAGERPEDTIVSMNFTYSTEERVQSSGVSDPTSRIAGLFRQVNHADTRAARAELRMLIDELSAGLNALRNCVTRLPERTRRIVELLYFEERTWEDVEGLEGINRSTVQYHRKKAIEAIACMPPYYHVVS